MLLAADTPAGSLWSNFKLDQAMIVPIVCFGDAHASCGLDAVEYPVHTARRGRGTAEDAPARAGRALLRFAQRVCHGGLPGRGT